MTKLKPLLIVLVLLQISCNTKDRSENDQQSSVDFEFEEELKKYLEEIHNINFVQQDDVVLFLIPVSGCAPCTERAFKFAYESSYRDAYTLLCGSMEKDLIKLRSRLKYFSDDKLILDMSGEVEEYKIVNYEPLFLHYNKGSLVYSSYLEDDDIENITQYMQWEQVPNR